MVKNSNVRHHGANSRATEGIINFGLLRDHSMLRELAKELWRFIRKQYDAMEIYVLFWLGCRLGSWLINRFMMVLEAIEA